jgi:formylglycine-generating enzyme required for sulfatase activity
MRTLVGVGLVAAVSLLGGCSLLADYEQYTKGGAGAGGAAGSGGAAGASGVSGGGQAGQGGKAGQGGGGQPGGGSSGAGGLAGTGGAGGASGVSGGGQAGEAGMGGMGGMGDGSAIGVEGGTCTSGAACVGHAQAKVLTCESGIWKAAPDCADGKLCDTRPGAGAGQCVAIAAGCTGKTPGDVACDAEKKVKCGPDLVTSDPLATCKTAAHCEKGTGETCAPCVTGEFQCQGATLLSCSEQTGLFVMTASCSSAVLCDATKGVCKVSVCEVGEAKCMGDTLQTCKADQSGFEGDTACMPGLCDMTGKQCDVCKAGVAMCLDNKSRMVCSADGQMNAMETCAVATPFCDPKTNGCVECLADTDCPASPSECQKPVCSAAGVCGFSMIPAGSASSIQTDHDCKKRFCDKNGLAASQNDDSDLPADDGNPCTTEACSNGTPMHTSLVDGATCPAGACLGGLCTQNASCADGVFACGTTCTDGKFPCVNDPGASPNSDCCFSPKVTGGSFSRGYDASNNGSLVQGFQTMAAAPATVTDFLLNKFEVSVYRFRQFVDVYPNSKPIKGTGAFPAGGFDGWRDEWTPKLPADKNALIAGLKACGIAGSFTTWVDDPADAVNNSRPINCVTWYEAMAFCAWDGGRLPTEAEWNFAAAGGSLQRAYPWSSSASSLAIDETFASYQVDTNSKLCFGDKKSGCAATDIVPTGSYAKGAGAFGHLDLSGNVSEWVLDALGTPATYAQASCTDCTNVQSAPPQVVARGGNYNSTAEFLRTAYRFGYPPSTRSDALGFRCVKK